MKAKVNLEKNMGFLLLSVFSCLLSLDGISQNLKDSCSFCENRCSYETVNGKMTGKYISYHFNGRLKAAGMLENGYHKGNWEIWDSTGNLVMKRSYENPFVFKQIFPAVSSNKLVQLLNQSKYYPQRNAAGIIKYQKLKAENALIRHKIWRNILPENNLPLFYNDRFFKIIQQAVKQDSSLAFDVVDDRFTTNLSKEKITDAFSNYRIISYKIKEEYIFDNDRLLSEFRIMGICPVGINKATGDTSSLFWLYYPNARELFAKHKLKDKELPLNITDYDDFFFYRHFSSFIYKTTHDNPYDYPIALYPGYTAEMVKQEVLIQEMALLEMEHDFWLYYSSAN